jgi:hypothetical protein
VQRLPEEGLRAAHAQALQRWQRVEDAGQQGAAGQPQAEAEAREAMLEVAGPSSPEPGKDEQGAGPSSPGGDSPAPLTPERAQEIQVGSWGPPFIWPGGPARVQWLWDVMSLLPCCSPVLWGYQAGIALRPIWLGPAQWRGLLHPLSSSCRAWHKYSPAVVPVLLLSGIGAGAWAPAPADLQPSILQRCAWIPPRVRRPPRHQTCSLACHPHVTVDWLRCRPPWPPSTIACSTPASVRRP